MSKPAKMTPESYARSPCARTLMRILRMLFMRLDPDFVVITFAQEHFDPQTDRTLANRLRSLADAIDDAHPDLAPPQCPRTMAALRKMYPATEFAEN